MTEALRHVISLASGRRLAAAVARELPTATFRLIPGVGHYSLPIRHAQEILTDLVAFPLQTGS